MRLIVELADGTAPSVDGRRATARLVGAYASVMNCNSTHRWQTVAVVAVAMFASVSCATSRSTEVIDEIPVTGLVLAGPTCPVAQDPPDPDCADRPVPDAAITITARDGDLVGEVRTDRTGRFTLQLAAGTFTFTPQPVDGLLGTPDPQTVTVGPTVDEIDFVYDTGIR
jgi:hypothetical protein